MGILIVLGVMRVRGEASVVTGNPSGGLTGSIPTSASVVPFANATWTDCLFGQMTPVANATCSSTLQISTNSDISVRLQASPLTNGNGRRLISAYVVHPPAGGTINVNPDTGQTAQLYQTAAPFATVQAYAITGTAQNDSTSTISGTYTGQILMTVVAASTDLSAPTGFTATAGENQIAASWSAVSGASNYELGWHLGATFDPNQAVLVSVSGTSYTLTGLTNGQTYSLAVRSVVGSTKSAWSNAAQATPTMLVGRVYRDAASFTHYRPDCGVRNEFCWSKETDIGTYLSLMRTNSSTVMNITVDDAARTTLTPLPSNARFYKVWLLVAPRNTGNQGTYRVTVVGGGQVDVTMPPSKPGGVFFWLYAGNVTYQPSQEIRVWMPPNVGLNLNGQSWYDNHWKGIYFTEGNETPTCSPSGSGGDQLSC
ncbi:MAG: fibronectin type III domain-containing protein [Nitrospirota bacterium]